MSLSNEESIFHISKLQKVLETLRSNANAVQGARNKSEHDPLRGCQRKQASGGTSEKAMGPDGPLKYL